MGSNKFERLRPNNPATAEVTTIADAKQVVRRALRQAGVGNREINNNLARILGGHPSAEQRQTFLKTATELKPIIR